MEPITLYHVGFEQIPVPDVHYGRKNADFGQGFYLSDSEDFSKRWARERRGMDTVINCYELTLDGLNVKRLVRGEEWFDIIFTNRSYARDKLSEYDVVIGPIANDTIYDTWGITTSGLLTREHALALLMLGGEYSQTVIKTESAASQLRFISAEVLDSAEIAACRELVSAEETAFQELFSAELERLIGSE